MIGSISRRSLPIALLSLMVASATSQASIQYTGSISNSPDSDLTLGGDWSAGTLSWIVTDNMNGTWNYSYSFELDPARPETSHFIFEISANVDSIGLFTNVSGNFDNYELGQGGAPSNPSIPGDFTNAIKFNFDDPGVATVAFDIARLPTWGDFYAKGGSANGNLLGTAYNSGFVGGDANDPLNAPLANGPHINTDGLAHIMVPDTIVPPNPNPQDIVPEATSALIWLGLACVYSGRSRRRKLARV